MAGPLETPRRSSGGITDIRRDCRHRKAIQQATMNQPDDFAAIFRNDDFMT